MWKKIMTDCLQCMSKKYKVNELEDYTQYVCIDNHGKYCIFRNRTSIDKDIILDTYTIDLPEFIEKYNKAKPEEKVGMNIERFVNAINDKDYKYGYGLLMKYLKPRICQHNETLKTI